MLVTLGGMVTLASCEKVARILSAILKARASADNAGIPIATKTVTRFLLFREISHVEVIRNDVNIRLMDGSEIVVRTPLSGFLPKLMGDGRFAQCHRSFVINLDAVASINDREVFLHCGRKAPVSKSYAEFGNLYFNRVFGKLGKQLPPALRSNNEKN